MYGFSKYDAQDRYDSYNTVQVKVKTEYEDRCRYPGLGQTAQIWQGHFRPRAIKALIREDIARGQADGTQG